MRQDFFEPGVVYHVFNRGNNKENIFFEEENYRYFLELLKKYLLPIADIYAYCLLKNHFHLVIKIKDYDQLEEKYQTKPYLPFSHFFNAYTKAVNKKYNRTGSLFQKHLHRKRIEDEKYLIQLIAYVHLNPVKHLFTDDYKKYRYSSYQAYISEKSSSVEREYVLSLFGDKENFEYWHDINVLNFLDDVEDVGDL
ncbi:MAG: hypothetical protein PHP31_06250 [Lentimicrobiaceae bacterium]|nr:hypothetical protein [Lentimicrobiaceae bacterium]